MDAERAAALAECHRQRAGLFQSRVSDRHLAGIRNSVAARATQPENCNAIRPNRDGRPSLLRCIGGVVKSAVADPAFSTLFLLGRLIVGHKVKRQIRLALEDG